MKPVWQNIIDINRNTIRVTVENSKGHRYEVNVSPDMEHHVKGRSVIRGDLAKVTKSPVSGEWIMIDFKPDPAMYKDIDVVECTCNQVSLDVFNEPDYSFNTGEGEWL